LSYSFFESLRIISVFWSEREFLCDKYFAVFISFAISLRSPIGSCSVHAGYLYEAALKPSRISGLSHEVAIYFAYVTHF